MRRGSAKKGNERRKRPRSTKSGARARPSARGDLPEGTALSRERAQISPDSCQNCGKSLAGADDRALFVEEEVGRIFCTEACIAAYFTPEIDRLEKDYFRRLSSSDLNADERESLAHLRWLTLQEPDEVWREKTLAGDYRYTLISEFVPSSKKVWSVCICLFLKGEPSFLYLAFTTKNAAMANHYRRGERVQWVKPSPESLESHRMGGEEGAPASDPTDRLADAWTEDETFLANMSRERRDDDIPVEDYGLYQSCLEETLETPDEVWSVIAGSEKPVKIYHFIKRYPEERPNGIWFVVIAREVEEDEQLELVDAFPTRDASLVQNHRQGEQEVGTADGPKAAARVVH